MYQRFFLPIALLAATLSGCSKTAHSTSNPPVEPAADATPIGDKPLTADTHFAAGQLAESRGDVDSAVNQYQSALKLNKNHIKTLYRLGCDYAQLKQYSQSIEMWKRYLKATDNAPTGYSNLAYTEELAGSPEQAETDYKKGITKDPTNEPCRVNFGLMLARHGRIGEAIIQLQAVLNPAEVHYNIATVYEMEQRPEMAKIEYQEALALDPNFSEAREKLATLGFEFIDEE